jgi:predicted SAM-dependent methyltransferase
MILDIGCGKNPTGNINIDISEDSWADMICSCYDIKLNREFDEIHIFEVLEHLENPTKALKEAKRLLKKDGVIKVTIPNQQNIFRLYRQLRNKRLGMSPEHIHSWDRTEMENMINSLGMHVVEFSYKTWVHHETRDTLKGKARAFILRFFPRHLRHGSLMVEAKK